MENIDEKEWAITILMAAKCGVLMGIERSIMEKLYGIFYGCSSNMGTKNVILMELENEVMIFGFVTGYELRFRRSTGRVDLKTIH